MKPIRVLIVDDHPIVRKGIQMMVSTEPSIQIVGEAGNGQDAIHLAKSLCPDVILMDLMMPECDGIEATAEIKRFISDVKIIILTIFRDEVRVNAALKAGADGYLLKDTDGGEALLQAIQAVQRGEMPLHPRVVRQLIRSVTNPIDTNGIGCLTEREKEILQWVAKGLSNKSVAQSLNLSEGTVKIHVSNILAKLHVSSRIEAALWAVERGLVALEEQRADPPFGLGHLS